MPQKNWIRLWPLLLLCIITPVSMVNVDYVILPWLAYRGWDNKLELTLLCGGIGFGELWLWYFAWGGLSKMITRWLEADIHFLKKIEGEADFSGYKDRIKVHFSRRYYKLLHQSKKVTFVAKSGGYFIMFFLGVCPYPGPRVMADFVCGTAHWKKGFVFLAIGNFVKTILFVYGWTSIF
jgi:hypothetical protein